VLSIYACSERACLLTNPFTALGLPSCPSSFVQQMGLACYICADPWVVVLVLLFHASCHLHPSGQPSQEAPWRLINCCRRLVATLWRD
jgi:hypothetical protein